MNERQRSGYIWESLERGKGRNKCNQTIIMRKHEKYVKIQLNGRAVT